MTLNTQTLAVIAQECVECDARGVDPMTVGALADDLDRMDGDQRRRILDYRQGAAYERDAVMRRGLAARAAAPTPLLAADWQRRAAQADRTERALRAVTIIGTWLGSALCAAVALWLVWLAIWGGR